MRRVSLLVPCVLFVLCGCGTTTPSSSHADPTLVQLTGSAVQAFDIGAFERAARFYELALDRARVIDDSLEVAKNAQNLAACRIKLGQFDEASPLLLDAKGEFERNKMDVSAVLLLQAAVAKGKGDAAGAGALLDQVLQSGSSKPASRLQAYIVKTDLACDAGNREDAEVNLNRAKRLGGSVSDDALRGGVARVEGRVELLKAHPTTAAAAFDREADSLKKAHRYREMAAALDRSGSAWSDAGGAQQAADRFFRAARSFHAQGDLVAALKSVDRAMTASKQTSDQEQAARIAALLNEIKAELDKASAAPDAKSP